MPWMLVHPPSAPESPDPLTALADRCVQCGLCLPHCPTYRLDRSEAESPRGRIAMARALATGTLAPGGSADTHLDHCLGCRRCEAACPAGVEYGALLVASRALQRQRRRPAFSQRAAEALMARPALLQRLASVYRWLHPVLPRALRRLPRPPAPPGVVPARPGPEAPTLFLGCIARSYDAPTHAALARFCAALGTGLSIPRAQGCCGALHAHAGDTATAGRLGSTNAKALAGDGPVLACASGCQGTLAATLDGVAEVEDALVWLDRQRERLAFRPAAAGAGPVALHLPCSQRLSKASIAATRRLLAAVPGLAWVELPDTGCCGAAGSHMLLFPGRAAELATPLHAAAAGFGARTLLSANVGCRLHLARDGLRVIHPLTFLAEHLA